MRRAPERPASGANERFGDRVAIPPARMYQGTRNVASSSSATRVLPAAVTVHVALNSWLVGWSVNLVSFTSCRRLDDDREKQVELPGMPRPSDAHRHPHAARLTVGRALEDLDLSDDVRAPLRVAVDRRNQTQTRRLRRRAQPPPLGHGIPSFPSLGNHAKGVTTSHPVEMHPSAVSNAVIAHGDRAADG